MKSRDLKGMSNEEKSAKIKELKMELIKSRINASKTGSLKTREIKKTIAKLLTTKEEPNQTKK